MPPPPACDKTGKLYAMFDQADAQKKTLSVSAIPCQEGLTQRTAPRALAARRATAQYSSSSAPAPAPAASHRRQLRAAPLHAGLRP